eukprot:4969133-Prymnesium_polylepis.1
MTRCGAHMVLYCGRLLRPAPLQCGGCATFGLGALLPHAGTNNLLVAYFALLERQFEALVGPAPGASPARLSHGTVPYSPLGGPEPLRARVARDTGPLLLFVTTVGQITVFSGSPRSLGVTAP